MLTRLRRLMRRRSGRRFVAVDIDASRLRICQAERSGDGVRILKLASAAVPADLDLGDAAATGEFLGRALDEAGLGGSGILMTVPRARAMLKPMTLPPTAGRDELARLVQYQVEKELPFPPDEAVIDFTRETHFDAEAQGDAEEAPAGQDVLVAAVQQTVVDHYRQVAEAAGARLLRLGLRPYADQRAVLAYARLDPATSVAVVHVMADQVEIDVLDGYALTFSRSASVHGEADVPSAGDEPAAEPAPDTDPVTAVVTEAARSLRSYVAVERARAIDTVLVAGGTGYEDQVADEISRWLGVESQRFDPSGLLGLTRPAGDMSAFVSVLGLAISHHGGDAPPYDFLHPKRPAVPGQARRRRMAAAGVAAGAVVVGLATVVALWLGGKEDRNERLRLEIESLQRQAKVLARQRRCAEAVETWQGPTTWLDHWARASALFPPPGQVYVSDLTARRDKRHRRGRDLASGTDAEMELDLHAADQDVLSRIAARLSGADYVFTTNQINPAARTLYYPIGTTIEIRVDSGADLDLSELEAPPRPEDDMSMELLKAGKDWKRVLQERTRTTTEAATGGGAEATSSENDPGGVAAIKDRLLQAYDTDKDGRLSGTEYGKARAALETGGWDLDGNGSVSAAERGRIKRVLFALRGGWRRRRR